MNTKQRRTFAAYVALVLMFCTDSVTVYATGRDPLAVVNNLSTFIFEDDRAAGKADGWQISSNVRI